MADQAVVEKATHRLSKAEAQVLCDEAKAMMLNDAVERINFPEPHSERMIEAADVYGALARLRFDAVKGLPAPSEAIEAQFSAGAMAFLKRTQQETRGMLREQRGTCEIADYTDGSGSTRNAFLLWVLDGIFEEVA